MLIRTQFTFRYAPYAETQRHYDEMYLLNAHHIHHTTEDNDITNLLIRYKKKNPPLPPSRRIQFGFRINYIDT